VLVDRESVDTALGGGTDAPRRSNDTFARGEPHAGPLAPIVRPRSLDRSLAPWVASPGTHHSLSDPLIDGHNGAPAFGCLAEIPQQPVCGFRADADGSARASNSEILALNQGQTRRMRVPCAQGRVGGPRYYEHVGSTPSPCPFHPFGKQVAVLMRAGNLHTGTLAATGRDLINCACAFPDGPSPHSFSTAFSVNSRGRSPDCDALAISRFGGQSGVFRRSIQGISGFEGILLMPSRVARAPASSWAKSSDCNPRPPMSRPLHAVIGQRGDSIGRACFRPTSGRFSKGRGGYGAGAFRPIKQ